jgi:hypothetical protein
VDFDGTIVRVGGPPFAYVPGAREALARLKAAGHQIILHSARCTTMDPGPVVDEEVATFYRTGEVNPRISDQWRRFVEMRGFLQSEGLWRLFDEVWQAPGKPPADVYIDDRAEPANWARLVAELGARE